MTVPLPPDMQTGVLTPGLQWGSSSTVWVITFQPRNVKRLLSRISITPPTGIPSTTRLIVWNDTTRLTVAPNGTSTEYEPYRPIVITAGTYVYLVWYTNQGTAPQGSLFAEESVF